MSRPKILITNDDSIHARGIKALYRAMCQIGDAQVVAPESEKSGVGHGITLITPLRARHHTDDDGFSGWAVNGTPADCVKLATKELLAEKPDLVVSGINRGSNTATNTIYSGTVSGALEAAILGIPAVAFSLTSFEKVDLSFAEEAAMLISRKVLEHGLPADTVLNVNIPPAAREDIKGYKITRQGRGRYEDAYERRVDTMGRPYFWLAGTRVMLDEEDDLDEVAIENNYVSITPIHFDLTNNKMLTPLKDWNLSL